MGGFNDLAPSQDNPFDPRRPKTPGDQNFAAFTDWQRAMNDVLQNPATGPGTRDYVQKQQKAMEKWGEPESPSLFQGRTADEPSIFAEFGSNPYAGATTPTPAPTVPNIRNPPQAPPPPSSGVPSIRTAPKLSEPQGQPGAYDNNTLDRIHAGYHVPSLPTSSGNPNDAEYAGLGAHSFPSSGIPASAPYSIQKMADGSRIGTGGPQGMTWADLHDPQSYANAKPAFDARMAEAQAAVERAQNPYGEIRAKGAEDLRSRVAEQMARGEADTQSRTAEAQARGEADTKMRMALQQFGIRNAGDIERFAAEQLRAIEAEQASPQEKDAARQQIEERKASMLRAMGVKVE